MADGFRHHFSSHSVGDERSYHPLSLKKPALILQSVELSSWNGIAAKKSSKSFPKRFAPTIKSLKIGSQTALLRRFIVC